MRPIPPDPPGALRRDFRLLVFLLVLPLVAGLIVVGFVKGHSFAASPVDVAKKKLQKTAEGLTKEAGYALTNPDPQPTPDQIRTTFAEHYGDQVLGSRVTPAGEIQWDFVVVAEGDSRSSWTYDATMVGVCFRLSGHPGVTKAQVTRTDLTCPAGLATSATYGYDVAVHLKTTSKVVYADNTHPDFS